MTPDERLLTSLFGPDTSRAAPVPPPVAARAVPSDGCRVGEGRGSAAVAPPRSALRRLFDNWTSDPVLTYERYRDGLRRTVERVRGAH